MLTLETTIESDALVLRYQFINPAPEPVFVFDQLLWSAPGATGGGDDWRYTSEVAYVCLDGQGVCFLHGAPPKPRSPPFLPWERILPGATLVARGGRVAHTLRAALPLQEWTPYGPAAAAPVRGTVSVACVRFVLEYVRKRSAGRTR